MAQIADTLHELGFKGLRATGLRRKHVVALVKEWKRQGRSIGTMKNRTAHIRWWAKRVGRPGVVPANGELGIANREYVTGEDRSAVLDPEKLARGEGPARRDGASPGGGVRASQGGGDQVPRPRATTGAGASG